MQFLPTRKVVTHETYYPSKSNVGERSFQEAAHETTTVERAVMQHQDSRRSSQVETSLPILNPMECSISEAEVSSAMFAAVDPPTRWLRTRFPVQQVVDVDTTGKARFDQ